MSVTDQPAGNRKRFWTILTIAALLVVLVAVVVAVQLGRGPDGAQTTSNTGTAAAGGTGTAVPSPAGASPDPSAPAGTAPTGAAAAPVSAAPGIAIPPADQQAAVQDMDAFVSGSAAIMAAQTQPSDAELAALATGSALGSLQADTAEFAKNGWHQEGQPTVVSTNVVAYDPAAAPPQLTLNVCIDSSKVNILTAAGDAVRTGTDKDRSLNILTLNRSDDGKWLVSRVSFPDDPTC
ncbi:hypothetical protein [Arthrobacter sp. A5]|uniref:hypothetical protein n=1 Tax=Arthrobacter sp. A5 TaxID=576926 RepID=UPI003DA9264F